MSARDPRYPLPIGSVVLSVLGWLAQPTPVQPSERRTGGLPATVLFACVVFLFPASFVLFGYAAKVISLVKDLCRRLVRK